MIADRRALHRIPELDFRLDRTAAYIRNALSSLRCEVFSPIEGSVCAFFDNGAASSIAFRSDADALPIIEKTGLPFASEHPGRMHACGHDVHMAMLLEHARRMDKAKAPHNILLIFQPAEETIGGAHKICETGIFEKYNTEAVFGLHLWPDVPGGRIASRANEMMSSACEVTIDIYGKASHIAKASEGIDSLRAGIEFMRRCEAIEAAYPENVYRLLRFGRMESGRVRNAVSAHTHIEGTLRAFQEDVFHGMLQALRQAADEIAAETRCRFEITTSEGYPAVMNPQPLYDQIQSFAEFDELPLPVMIAEDFSWYQKYIPGMFFFLGCGPAPALHADTFTIDESIMEAGAKLWEDIAMKFGGMQNA